MQFLAGFLTVYLVVNFDRNFTVNSHPYPRKNFSEKTAVNTDEKNRGFERFHRIEKVRPFIRFFWTARNRVIKNRGFEWSVYT